jgi:hypothetical protein
LRTITEESAKGKRGFERALYQLQGLLEELATDPRAEEAPLSTPAELRMNGSMLQHYNRLAVKCGFDTK